MGSKKKDIAKRISEIEERMSEVDFWNDKDRAQETVKELHTLKAQQASTLKYDTLGVVVTIHSGAGGDDAEDFVRILFAMYVAYVNKKGWELRVIHDHANETGGYKNVTFEIEGKNVYGTLKKEAGVHRLVRISPFSSKKLRHTSFAMVEVTPLFNKKDKEIEINESDLDIQFARAGGPGGQNVNKRETAVRITHTPTGISVHASTGRTQGENRERALEILKGKLYARKEESEDKRDESFRVGSTTQAEWGSQIRSYVLHPYKMVKDHRTDVEVRDVDAVLGEGAIDEFIEAEKKL